MTQFTCPEGHASNTAGECSECGATMDDAAPMRTTASPANGNGATSATASPAASPTAHAGAHCDKCPSCEAPRENESDEICPNCGADYASGALELPPAAVPASQPTSAAPGASTAASGSPSVPAPGGNGGKPAITPPALTVDAPASPTASATTGQSDGTVAGDSTGSSKTQAGLIAVVTVDLSAREGRPDDEPTPSDQSEHIYELTGPFISFGRGRTATILIQEDGGVSRMQGEFVLLPDGSYGVRDGIREADGGHKPSANGTEVNGKPCIGSEVRRVKEGDVITVGFFHRIEIRSAGQA